MKIEVLLATMHQKDFSFLEKMNIQTDVLVINQCDEVKIEEIQFRGHHVKMIYTKERGLSRSRNMALKNATGDICVIADDDVCYYDDLEKNIQDAFNECKDADIISFSAKRILKDGMTQETFRKKNVVKRNLFTVGKVTSYEIAFIRKKVLASGILFDINFGTGSGRVLHGEENIFLRDCIRKGLKIYSYPKCILEVMAIESSWFRGYDQKFFEDYGAINARSMGIFSLMLILLNVIRKYPLYKNTLTPFAVLQLMCKGEKKWRKEYSKG